MNLPLAIIQARMSSTRFPGKVLELVNGKPMIEWQIERTFKSKISNLIVATSIENSDDALCSYLDSIGIETYRGSISNVFSRFQEIVNQKKPDYFLRLTADCPLVMPDLIDEMIEIFQRNKLDCLTNCQPPTYPDGLDIEIVSTEAFMRLDPAELGSEELEHVTLGIYKRPNSFQILNHCAIEDLSSLRWTVDYPQDLEFIREVYALYLGRETEFTFKELLSAIEQGFIRENEIPGSFRNISLNDFQSGGEK